MRYFTTIGLVMAIVAPNARAEIISFTPDSVLFPITGVHLVATSGDTTSFYTCAGTEEACMVDLTDPTALAAKLGQGSEVAVGEYDKISLATCDADKGNTYNVKIKGEVALGGATYYTNTADVLSTTGPAQDVAINLTHCSGKITALPTKAKVEEGGTTEISLFLSTKNLAWATVTAADVDKATHGADCAVSADKAKALCIAYPDLVGYVGSVAPVAETYNVAFAPGTTAAQANGQLILAKDASDNILAGMSRKLWLPDSTDGGCQMGFPLNIITASADDTVDLVSGEPGGGTLLKFPSFSRTQSHSGTATCRFDTTNAYTAFQQ